MTNVVTLPRPPYGIWHSLGCRKTILCGQYGSPPERKLGLALNDCLPPHVKIRPQEKIGRYRADFLVIDEADYFPSYKAQFVVECDGHEWHERTKKQAKRDRQRDRWFLARGIPTIRFTGSEIHADASCCAYEVMNILFRVYPLDVCRGRRAIMRAGAFASTPRLSHPCFDTLGCGESDWKSGDSFRHLW